MKRALMVFGTVAYHEVCLGSTPWPTDKPVPCGAVMRL